MRNKKIRFAKVLLCPFNSDSRSKRECEVVKEAGFDVSIYDTSIEKDDVIESIYHHFPTPDKFQGGILKRLGKFLRWAYKLHKGNYDVISAYDISALLISWLSNFGKSASEKSLLIYDSHEFEYGRHTARAKWISRIVVKIEGFLMKRVVQSIMVNETIAEEVQKLHNLPVTPIVCRNVAPYTKIDYKKCLNKREMFFSKASKSGKDTKILMYHGAVVSGRGIEVILETLCELNNVLFVVLGNGKQEYLETLDRKIELLQIKDKVLFHPAVPVKNLWEYVGAADIGLVNIENVSLSYYYSLPNKLFENIQAGVPIVGSNFPEIEKIIEGYGIGLTCDTSSVDETAKSINKLLDDNELYALCKYNTIKAKEALCWEKEKEVLIDFYMNIYNDIERQSNESSKRNHMLQ